MSFGQRVKYRRKELHMTQEELANKLGMVSKSSVCRVENGYEDNPTIDRIQKFARALDTSYAYLMELTSISDPNINIEEISRRGNRDGEILAIVKQLNDTNANIIKEMAYTLLRNQSAL